MSELVVREVRLRSYGDLVVERQRGAAVGVAKVAWDIRGTPAVAVPDPAQWRPPARDLDTAL